MTGVLPRGSQRADAKSGEGDAIPDELHAEKLRDTLNRDLSPLDQIGRGLKAIFNQPLMERLPLNFRRLLERL